MDVKKLNVTLSLLFLFTVISFDSKAQQDKPAAIPDSLRLSPVQLPGKGLMEHDFFYAGENGNNKNMYIVKKGSIVWSYHHPGNGEISDAVLLSDSSIVFAHQSGVSKISIDKKLLWNYDAPPGCEIHTAQPIGKSRVLFIQNGNPAKLLVMNVVTGKTEKEFILPTGGSANPHGHFRHARLTSKGNILVAHLDLQKIAEYDFDGKEVWSMPYNKVWSAVPLKNGNILAAGGRSHRVTELDKKGNIVWEISAEDFPGYKFSDMQVAIPLRNGNVLVNNWHGKGNGTAVQAIEVNRKKKIIWALRSWDMPADLGPSTIIQLLHKNEIPENVRFGTIK